MNDPAQILGLFLRGTLGRSGRKRARKAASFVSGQRGFLTASTILAAAGVAWGIYDSVSASRGGVVPPGVILPPGAAVPPLPQAVVDAAAARPPVPMEVLRIIRLAVSAARADGHLTPPERALILEHARQAGVEAAAEDELAHPHPLADIVRGVTDDQARRDLYRLAFAIIRADEAVSGGERIYLAQLAHQLGFDPATASALEAETAAGIDAADPTV